MSKETYMIESLTRDLIVSLMTDRKSTFRESMDIVYRSKTHEALCNPETGLYFQSPVYVYEELTEELRKTAEAQCM